MRIMKSLIVFYHLTILIELFTEFCDLQMMKEKDNKIESQQREITNLRKKNFDFRARIMELEDKAKDKKEDRK